MGKYKDKVRKPDNRPLKRIEAFLSERLAGLESSMDDDKKKAARSSVLSEQISLFAKNRLIELEKARQQVVEARGTKRAAYLEPPENNWVPLGPSGVIKSNIPNRPVVSGRTPGIAVLPGGKRIYIGAANGGVWRSEDGGISWKSLMEGFDLDIYVSKTDSLACGDIIVIPGRRAEEDIIHVGTGEGFTHESGYYGVGPLVSKDGGMNWNREDTLTNSTSDPNALEGAGFYALAVDPNNPEMLIGATNKGLFVRKNERKWERVNTREGGLWTPYYSVVVCKDKEGKSVFFAADEDSKIWESTDNGKSWNPLDIKFPNSGRIGRITLAAPPNNPEIVYALVALLGDSTDVGPKEGNLHGLHLLIKSESNKWKINEIDHSGDLDCLFSPEPMKKRDKGIMIAP